MAVEPLDPAIDPASASVPAVATPWRAIAGGWRSERAVGVSCSGPVSRPSRAVALGRTVADERIWSVVGARRPAVPGDETIEERATGRVVAIAPETAAGEVVGPTCDSVAIGFGPVRSVDTGSSEPGRIAEEAARDGAELDGDEGRRVNRNRGKAAEASARSRVVAVGVSTALSVSGPDDERPAAPTGGCVTASVDRGAAVSDCRFGV